jgi:plasmid stability protein
MPMIQIRNVGPEVHRKLKAKAAMEGMSLSDFLRKEVELLADQPSMDELMARIASRPDTTSPLTVAEMIRELRGPLPE